MLPFALAACTTSSEPAPTDAPATAPTDVGSEPADTAAPIPAAHSAAGPTGDSGPGHSGAVADPTWPASSVCLGVRAGMCADGVSAVDWSGAAAYEWRPDPGFASTTVYVGGAAAFEVSSASGFVPGGLAVAPDGDLFLSGSVIGPTSLVVDGVGHPLSDTYNRFVVRTSPAGDVRWVRSFAGITREATVVAPTADGGAIVVGELLGADTHIGPFLVPGAPWVETTLAARMDGSGAWLWATAAPSSANPPGELLFGAIEPAVGSDVVIVGDLRGELTIGAGAVGCAAIACPAELTMRDDGTFVDLALR